MQTQTSTVPNSSQFEGLTFRPLTEADAQQAAALIMAHAQTVDRIDKVVLPQELLAEWQRDNLAFETDSLAAVTDSGELVAYIELWDGTTAHVNIHAWGVIHPGYRQRGIEQRLLRFAEARGREFAEKAPPHARVILIGSASANNTSYIAALEDYGFQKVRAWHRMLITMTEPPQPVELPEGFSIRTHNSSAEDDQLAYNIIQTAFKDHFGYVDMPAERWLPMLKGPEWDSSLWFFAFEGDRPAGASLCDWKLWDNPELGWVNDLGVLREHRRKGIGRALLLHSFHEFYRRGRMKVGLGVDATSLTGANRLYESVGMTPFFTRYSFEFELRPGQDLVVRSL
jgi:mycothiol synthase